MAWQAALLVALLLLVAAPVAAAAAAAQALPAQTWLSWPWRLLLRLRWLGLASAAERGSC
jgi:hypothetical protein